MSASTPSLAIEWVLACRPGFEPEAASEGQALLEASGIDATAESTAGLVRFRFMAPIQRTALPNPARLVYARTAWAVFARLAGIDPKDRLSPLLATLEGLPSIADVWVEVPDGGDGAALAAFARSFEAALVAALRRTGRLEPNAGRLLRVLATSGTDLALAIDRTADLPPGRGGVPRLKLPREAPSRSALKIEEAWLTLLADDERERRLAHGMRAVDLGAAPGGWSWQLARRGLHVTAIDNGPLAPSALATGRIQHLRADGFRWRPPRPVDWLVCDMVEQPARVARLVAEWLARGDARFALFNLKLPMKKRWAETVACLVRLADTLDATLQPSVAAAAGRPPAPEEGARFELRARQLYHDREEITVLALPSPSALREPGRGTRLPTLRKPGTISPPRGLGRSRP